MATLDIKKIQAPDLTQSRYGANIREQFENIDDNFRKLANHDFQKGDTGTSIYTKDIKLTLYGGYKDEKYIYFTEEGQEVLISIIQNAMDKIGYTESTARDIFPTYTEGHYLSITSAKSYIVSAIAAHPKLVCLSPVNGLSIVDYFYDATSDSDVVTMTGVYSYDPVVGTDSEVLVGVTNNVVFRDERFVKITADLTEDDLTIYSDLIDTSCTVYGLVESGSVVYEITQNFPTLYYNAAAGVKAFCWNFAGSKTGIIASGPQGLAGASGEMYICTCDTTYTESTATYTLSKYHDPDNISSTDYYNTTVTQDNVPAGSNLIMFIKDEDDIYKTFISTAFHSDDNVVCYCGKDNCIQTQINITEFKSILDSISSSSTQLAGLYIPYTPGTDEYVHMLYGTKTGNFYDTLHIGATRYDRLGVRPSKDNPTYGFLDALQIDYNTTLINGQLGVGDISKGNSNHEPHNFHVNGSSLFDGEVHIQGHNDTCQTGKANKYAHLFVGGLSGTNSSSSSFGLQPGYVYIQSNTDSSGRLYVDSIHPYSATKDVLDRQLYIYGGWRNKQQAMVYVGDSSTASDMTVNGEMKSNSLSCLGQAVIKGDTKISSDLIVTKRIVVGNGVNISGNSQMVGSMQFAPKETITPIYQIRKNEYQEQSGRINVYNRFIQKSDLTGNTGYKHTRGSLDLRVSYHIDSSGKSHNTWNDISSSNNKFENHKWTMFHFLNDGDITSQKEVIRKISNDAMSSTASVTIISTPSSTRAQKQYRTLELQVWMEVYIQYGTNNTKVVLGNELLSTGFYTFPSGSSTKSSISINIPARTYYPNLSIDYGVNWNVYWGIYIQGRAIKFSSKKEEKDWGTVQFEGDFSSLKLTGTKDVDTITDEQVNTNLFLDAVVIKNSPGGTSSSTGSWMAIMNTSSKIIATSTPIPLPLIIWKDNMPITDTNKGLYHVWSPVYPGEKFDFTTLDAIGIGWNTKQDIVQIVDW